MRSNIKPWNVRLKFLKVAIGIALYGLLGSALYGQASGVTIQYSVSKTIVVSGLSTTFTIAVNNNTENAIANLEINPQMPDGMVYVDGTLSSVSGVAQKSGFDPMKPVFTLSSMAAGVVVFTFEAKADCRLKTYIANKGTLNPDDYKASLVYDGNPEKILANQSFNDFNILQPTIDIIIPQGGDIINLKQHGVLTRKFSIKNTTVEDLSSFEFQVESELNIQFNYIAITNADGSNSSILPTPSAIQRVKDGKTFKVYTYSILNSNGDNIFSAGEEIYFEENLNIEYDKLELLTNYIVNLSGQNCTSLTGINSKALKINSITGNPFLSSSISLNSTNQTCTYTINNSRYKGNKVFDAAYNVVFKLMPPQGYSINKLYLVSNSNKLELTRLNMTEYEYALVANAGDFGLSDLDGDGVLDDLDMSQSLKLEAEIVLDNKRLVNENRHSYSDVLNSEIKYNNWNGTFFSKAFEGASLFYYDKIYSVFYGAPNLGYSGVDPNNSAKYYFKLIGGVNSSALNVSNSEWVFDMVVPQGYVLNAVTKLNSLSTYSFEQDGTNCKIKTSDASIWGSNIEFTFQKTCNLIDREENLSITGRYYYDKSNLSNYYEFVTDDNYTVLNHCEVLVGMETVGFEAKRTTLGWNPLVNSNFYTYDQMYGTGKEANKVNPETPGLRLDAVYPNDKFQVTLKGKVSLNEYNGLRAEITYDSPMPGVDFNFFEFQTGSASININGSNYALNTTPVVSKLGNTYTFAFNVSADNTSIPTLINGDIFEMVVGFKFLPYNDLAPWEYLLKNFRGRFIGQNSLSTAWESCFWYGANLFLLKPEVSIANAYSTSRKCNDNIEIMRPFTVFGSIYTCVDFPNEYRPVSILKTFSLALPNGFVFKRENGEVGIDCNGEPLNNLSFSKSVAEAADDDLVNYNLNSDSKILNITNTYSNSLTCNATIITDSRFVPPPATYTDYDYRSYSIEMSLINYAYLDDITEHQIVTSTQTNHYDVNTFPKLKINGAIEKKVSGQSVYWDLDVVNYFYRGIEASNAWLALEMDNNEPYITFENPEGSGFSVQNYNVDVANNNKVQAQLIKFNTSISPYIPRRVRVKALYTSVDEAATGHLNAYSSWSCTKNIDVESGTPAIGSVRDMQTTLSQAELTMKYVPATFNITINIPPDNVPGDIIPIDIIIDPSPKIVIDDVIIEIILPDGIDPVTDEPCLPYIKKGDKIQYLDLTSGTLKFNVSQMASILPDGTYNGDEPIEFKMCVKSQDNDDPNIIIPIKVDGTPVIGPTIETEKDIIIPIGGLLSEQLNITASATSYLACIAPNNSNEITIVISNPMSTESQSDKLCVELSNNIKFDKWLGATIPGTLLKTPEIDLAKGITTYTFSMPAIASGESKTYKFRSLIKDSKAASSEPYFYITTNTTTDITDVNDQVQSIENPSSAVQFFVNYRNLFPVVNIEGFSLQSSVCKGTRVNLKAQVTGNSSEPLTYYWSPNGITTKSATYDVQGNMIVSVDVVGGNGCQSFDMKGVSVKENQNILGKININTSFECSTPSGILSVNHLEGSNYQWMKDNVVIPGEIESSLNISTSGTYNIYIENNNCGTYSDDILVDLNSQINTPDISVSPKFIETGYAVTAKVENWKLGNLYSFDWGDGIGSGTFLGRSTHTYSSPGKYKIAVMSSSINGCAKGAAEIEVEVVKSLCAGTFPLTIANSVAKFYLDLPTGRIVYRNVTCPNEIDLGCISGSADYPQLRRAVNASATTYSDQWDYEQSDLDKIGGFPENANDFDMGKAGKWRPNASFAYLNNLSSDNRNYNAGTFTLEAFNFKYPDCNNTSRWVKVNDIEYYSPGGVQLQQRDAIGIPSSAKYGYRNAVVYLSSQNAEKNDIFFESFENNYVVDGKGFFEDNMLYDQEIISLDLLNMHAGKMSALLKNNKKGITTRKFFFSQQVLGKGLLVNCWVRIENINAEFRVRNDMKFHLVDGTGQILATAPFKVIAHVGEWILVEASFNDLYNTVKYPQIKPFLEYYPTIVMLNNYKTNIDDIRIQPLDAKTSAYVFDPATLKILTIFDEQLFGLYHQYDQEGKLVRKQVETEKGIQTIQETFYNTPKKDK